MLGRQSCLRLKIILLLLYGVVQTEGALGVEGAREGEVDVSLAGLRHVGGRQAGERGGGGLANFPRQTETAVSPGVRVPVILH